MSRLKIDAYHVPIDMTYTLQIKGLDQAGLQRVSALAAEIAREQGEELDLSRIAGPQPVFRRIDL